MAPLGNDRCRTFPRRGPRRYRYAVRAWVDRLTSWRRDLARREDPRTSARQRRRREARGGGRRARPRRRRAHGSRTGRRRPRRLTAMPASCATWLSTGARRARGPVPRSAIRDSCTPSSRSSSIANARASARGTSCSPARRNPTALVTPRSRDLRSAARLRVRAGFRRALPAPDPPYRHAEAQGKNNALSPTRTIRAAHGLSAPRRRPQAVNPELGTLEDFRRLVATARDMGSRSPSTSPSSARPTILRPEHPEWFRCRPDGTIQYAENPPKKYEDIYPFDFDSDHWRGCGTSSRRALLGRQGVRDLPRRQPAHQAPRASGSGRSARSKRTYPEAIFLAEAFTRPKLMYYLAKLGFTQSYNYFPWRNTRQELTEYLTELTTTGAGLLPAQPVAQHPRYPDRACSTAGGRRSSRLVLAATLGASYGIYGPAFELVERAASARQRRISRLREIRDQTLGLSTGPTVSPL